jgi:hypothetical protein
MFNVKHFGTIGEAEYSRDSYIRPPLDEWDRAESWYFWRFDGAAPRGGWLCPEAIFGNRLAMLKPRESKLFDQVLYNHEN